MLYALDYSKYQLERLFLVFLYTFHFFFSKSFLQFFTGQANFSALEADIGQDDSAIEKLEHKIFVSYRPPSAKLLRRMD